MSASRSVALDLMLRTFMNSSQFQASRPRVWENVSRLVPGTTPQQVRHRDYSFCSRVNISLSTSFLLSAAVLREMGGAAYVCRQPS